MLTQRPRFQAIQSTTAITSGLRTLALILPLVIASILAGQLTFRTGYYVPQMLLSSVLTSVGAGLLTTWTVDSGRGKWIGYQILYGFGLGFGMQQSNMAVQAVLSRRDVPTGTALIFFAQALGGAVAMSVAQNLFASRFTDYLGGIQGLGAPVAIVLGAGATGLRRVVDPAVLGEVLQAFNKALIKALCVVIAASCFTIVGALSMEWRSIKHGEGQGEEGMQEAKRKEGGGEAKV